MQRRALTLSIHVQIELRIHTPKQSPKKVFHPMWIQCVFFPSAWSYFYGILGHCSTQTWNKDALKSTSPSRVKSMKVFELMTTMRKKSDFKIQWSSTNIIGDIKLLSSSNLSIMVNVATGCPVGESWQNQSTRMKNRVRGCTTLNQDFYLSNLDHLPSSPIFGVKITLIEMRVYPNGNLMNLCFRFPQHHIGHQPEITEPVTNMEADCVPVPGECNHKWAKSQT